MKQLTINGQKTWDDLGVWVEHSPSVGTAAPRMEWLTVPGMDGAYDLTGFFGEAKYGQRTISFVLIAPGGEEQRAGLETMHNGQTLKIVFPDDEDHYFIGRASVDSLIYLGSGETVCLAYTVICDPWRYKADVTSVTVSPTTAGISVTLTNEGRRINPAFTVSGSNVTITWQGGTYTLAPSATPYTVADIRLAAGDNPMTISGANGSSVVIEYQEAVL
jgi:hypothetical protein